MDINFSAVGFLQFVCYWLIASFFLRYLAARYHDRTYGKALGFLVM